MYKQFEYAQRSTRAAGPNYRWTLIVPVIIVGIALVTRERLQYGTSHLNVDSPAIFGVLLWISISLQFHWNSAPAINLTRQIYLVCYFLAGARVLQFILDTASSGVLLERSMQGLQPYFGYAFSALITVKTAGYISASRKSTALRSLAHRKEAN